MNKEILKYILIVVFIVGGCMADLQSKNWAKTNLKGKPTISVVPGFVEFGFAENRGMVFGIMNNGKTGIHSYLLLGLRIVILIVVLGFMVTSRKQSLFFHLPFVFIIAGAWGNIFDSITVGHVVDFIHIHLLKLLDWPFLFNVADAYICIGIVILLIKNLFQKPVAKTESPIAPPPSA